jgi:hypothetical protein
MQLLQYGTNETQVVSKAQPDPPENKEAQQVDGVV